MSNVHTVTAMFSRRGQVLALYKEILRLSKSWEAKDPQNTHKEREYIKSEARAAFRGNKNLTSEKEVDTKLKDAKDRIEIARHYRIPYPRPTYYGTGTLTKMAKKKLRGKDT